MTRSPNVAPLAAIAIAAHLVLAGGCYVETYIPRGVLLSCHDDSHCPNRWTCDLALALCVAPGEAETMDPELYDLRSSFCGALYNAAKACSPELHEVLGDNAQVFELPQPTFVHVCATQMLADTTMDDRFELRAGMAVLPLLPCRQLARMMCDMVEDPADAPGCPQAR